MDLLEDPEGAQRHILEIADRRRDEVKLAYGGTVTRRPSAMPQLTMRLGRIRKISGA
jgi:hypothetical protein